MSFSTMAAARQKDTNASMAVVAIKTLGSARVCADLGGWEIWFDDMSV
jgi:hypothetical protein